MYSILPLPEAGCAANAEVTDSLGVVGANAVIMQALKVHGSESLGKLKAVG